MIKEQLNWQILALPELLEFLLEYIRMRYVFLVLLLCVIEGLFSVFFKTRKNTQIFNLPISVYCLSSPNFIVCYVKMHLELLRVFPLPDVTFDSRGCQRGIAGRSHLFFQVSLRLLQLLILYSKPSLCKLHVISVSFGSCLEKDQLKGFVD